MQQKFKSLYQKYRDLRLINKYQQYARWTVASVFPQDTKTDLKGNSILQRDFQSMGAMLVNSLTAKLSKLLFPVGMSFFRLKESKQLRNALANIDSSLRKKELAQIEAQAAQNLLLQAGYAQIHQLIKTLIVTGNALVIRRNNKLLVYSPRNYSVLRDQDGTVIECILKQVTSYQSAPQAIKGLPRFRNKKPQDTVELYTRIHRLPDGRYQVAQQCQDIPVWGPQVYAKNLCPYIPVVWGLVNGDSYGHGIVQDYAGDFAKLSMLSEALSRYEIDVCKVVNLVKRGAGSDVDALAQASCGDWVQADPDAVGKFQGGNHMLVQALLQDLAVITQRLSIAFMYSSNVRDAQRVTAQEIKQKVAEADQALGGVYSQLSKELHIPLAYLLLAQTYEAFAILIAGGKVNIQIVTGTAALGRAGDTQRLLQATQVLSVLIPALQQISKRFNTQKIVDKTLANYGVPLEDIMKSEEELQAQAQAQAQQMQALQMAQAGAQNLQNLQAV